MRTIFGSRLFGTALPTSDHDFKGVFVPSKRALVLGKVEDVITSSTGDKFSKNTADDVDVEMYSIKKYLKLLEEGQTNALDMLFAPSTTEGYKDTEIWRHLKANKDKVLSRKADSFVGYCLGQVNKYNFKIDRFQSLDVVLKAFQNVSSYNFAKVAELLPNFNIPNDLPYWNPKVPIQVNQTGTIIDHISICDKMIPYTVSVAEGMKILQRFHDEYGHRAKNYNHDWKAIYHGIRIAEECIELLTTGNITHPRPNADYLIRVRNGEEDFESAVARIKDMVEEIKGINSVLPDAPDYKWIENFLYDVHLNTINEI